MSKLTKVRVEHPGRLDRWLIWKIRGAVRLVRCVGCGTSIRVDMATREDWHTYHATHKDC